jgi:(S)-citramalyl-CoA lyase
MLAKSESAAEMRIVAEQTGSDVPLIALVESVAGLRAAHDIARAAPAVQALMFGGADYSADARCQMAWEPLLLARSTLAAAAAEAGIGCIDVPWLDVADTAGASAEAARVAALGYTGKALIHPSQVAPVHAGFAPTAEEVARARRIVEAAEHHRGAVLLDGRMIDRPVVLAAERVLRRARS